MTLSQERARLAEWRQQQSDWRRARGLRRHLLACESERLAASTCRRVAAVEAVYCRMAAWLKDDRAAGSIQAAWRRTVATRRAAELVRLSNLLRVEDGPDGWPLGVDDVRALQAEEQERSRAVRSVQAFWNTKGRHNVAAERTRRAALESLSLSSVAASIIDTMAHLFPQTTV